MANQYYHYYVEGENEKKIVEILKDSKISPWTIVPGKVDVLNVTKEIISNTRLMTLKKNVNVILVFDTDTEEGIFKLRDNLKILHKSPQVKNVYCVPQVLKIEDEIINATSLKTINGFFETNSKKEFKGLFNKSNPQSIVKILSKENFDFEKFWNKIALNVYKEIPNDSSKLKRKG